jgi:hypothetical protein
MAACEVCGNEYYPVLPSRRRGTDAYLRQLRVCHPSPGPGVRSLRLQDCGARDRGEQHVLLLRALRSQEGRDRGRGPRLNLVGVSRQPLEVVPDQRLTC